MSRRTFLKQLAYASTALSSAVAFSDDAQAACSSTSRCLPLKWFFVQSAISNDTYLANLKAKLDQAKTLGLNGMVLACLGWDRLDLWWNGSAADQASVLRLFSLKEYADSLGIEIIPLGFSIGYAASLYLRNQHLLEGQLVSKTRFKVANGVAKHDPEIVSLKNPGFEDSPSTPNTLPGWSQDAPGSRTFIDTAIKRPGSLQSVRFENFSLEPHGLARIWQTVDLKQDRTYSLTFWVKMDNYTGSAASGVASFNVQVYRLDGSFIASFTCPLTAGATFDWTQFTFAFPSLDQTQVRLWIRCADGKSGRVWVDDVSLVEAPPIHILKRSGCPVTVSVTGAGGGPLTAGTDYQPLSDPQFGSNYFSYERQSANVPVLTLAANSPLKNDTALEVSYYQYISPFQKKNVPAPGTSPVYSGQLVACMTSPELFDSWIAPLAYLAHWKPKRLFLSWDEIRSLHACENCRKIEDPGVQMAYTLVMFARYVEYYMPGTELIVWSDMYDINHNAALGSRYTLSRDPFTHEPAKILLAAESMVDSKGEKLLKRKPTIMCWNHDTAAASIKYFSDLGFPVLAATYYDEASDNNCDWLQKLQPYSQAQGMMYTTWREDYSHLDTFAQTFGTNCQSG